ncbi:hypothetical protein J6590_055493 [Homalodisca vitripennis]|nr:hypothetical protein J6590_055493 [Homalodisca vitripennis]
MPSRRHKLSCGHAAHRIHTCQRGAMSAKLFARVAKQVALNCRKNQTSPCRTYLNAIGIANLVVVDVAPVFPLHHRVLRHAPFSPATSGAVRLFSAVLLSPSHWSLTVLDRQLISAGGCGCCSGLPVTSPCP